MGSLRREADTVRKAAWTLHRRTPCAMTTPRVRSPAAASACWHPSGSVSITRRREDCVLSDGRLDELEGALAQGGFLFGTQGCFPSCYQSGPGCPLHRLCVLCTPSSLGLENGNRHHWDNDNCCWPSGQQL